MNHTELLALKKETELKLQEIELKLQETELSFIDSDGFEVSILRGGNHFEVSCCCGEMPTKDLPKLIRILTNFATQHNL